MQRTLHPKVDGQWLRSLGPFGPVSVTRTVHGTELIGWAMPQGFSHPLLRSGAVVELFQAGECVDVAVLIEPSTSGEFSALGLWHDAERMPAMSDAVTVTSAVDPAIDYALSVGGIRFTRSASISATPLSEDATASYTVAGLLDAYTDSIGDEWSINPRLRAAEVRDAEAATPRWRVSHAVAGRGLTPADDEFYTHLVGKYWTGSAYTHVTASVAAVQPRFRIVDLEALGAIDATRAAAELNARLVKVGARMGWADGLDLGFGQITNMGGEPVSPTRIRNGDGIRLEGVVDVSRPSLVRGYTDVTVAECSFTDGSDRIQIKPRGKAARNFEELLTFIATGPDNRHH